MSRFYSPLRYPGGKSKISPYYVKGQELYVNYYKHEDHLEILSTIKKIKKQLWILSYDNHIELKKMYKNYRLLEYQLNYSASKAQKGEEIIFYCNSMIIPLLSFYCYLYKNTIMPKIYHQPYCQA